MKKIKLKSVKLDDNQLLSKEQLKKLLGGGEVIFTTEGPGICLIQYKCDNNDYVYGSGVNCSQAFQDATKKCNNF